MVARPRQRTRRNVSAKETIANANAMEDPFAELHMTMELPYSRLSEIRLRWKSGPSLSNTEREWMLKSVAELKGYYEKSIMEWDEAEKQRDLRHPQQRFLIASHEMFGERMAFLSFRWDLEEGEPIMYVYELGVAEEARGNRLGFALMRYAEDLNRKLFIESIMLTVFNNNSPAVRLYRDKLK